MMNKHYTGPVRVTSVTRTSETGANGLGETTVVIFNPNPAVGGTIAISHQDATTEQVDKMRFDWSDHGDTALVDLYSSLSKAQAAAVAKVIATAIKSAFGSEIKSDAEVDAQADAWIKTQEKN